jgi:hypothetical protein
MIVCMPGITEGDIGLGLCSSFGTGSGEICTSNGLGALAADRGGELSGDREGRGPGDVGETDGAA